MGSSDSQADRPSDSLPHDDLKKTAPAGWENSRVIGSYDTLGELGSGGQAIVYKASHRRTGAVVALKVLHFGPAFSEKARCQFDREIDLVAHLDHPYIVKVHDKGVFEQGYYFAMDYVRGQSLEEYLAAKDLSFRAKMQLLREICDGVAHAHQRGVIHRDLKPSNILVDERGSPHLLDFGYAKAAGTLGPGAGMVSLSLEIKGTPTYLSPEQAEGRPDRVDVRTDIYTLGVVFYQALTGQFPYDVSGGLPAILASIRSVEPVPPRTVCPGFDSDVWRIVRKCLEKDPDRRYQSAAELRDEIDRWLAGLPIHAHSGLFYILRRRAARHQYATAVVILLALIVAGFVTALGCGYTILDRQKTQLQKEVSDLRGENSRLTSGLESYALASLLLSPTDWQHLGPLGPRGSLIQGFLTNPLPLQDKYDTYNALCRKEGYPFLFRVAVAEEHLRENRRPEAVRSYQEAAQEKWDPNLDIGLRWLVDYRLRQLLDENGPAALAP